MIKRLFGKRLDQNEKLIRNIELYEEKKIKQQESEILGQKPVKYTENRQESLVE
tara:strand:+ start:1845 stop:2006 length:162 start_codon:yes stop_codon:yes gene_type:complete